MLKALTLSVQRHDNFCKLTSSDVSRVPERDRRSRLCNIHADIVAG